MQKKHVLMLKQLQHYQVRLSDFKTFIKLADNGFILFLCECIHNVLNGYVPVKLTHFKKFKTEIQELLKPTTTLATKKKIIATKRGRNLIKIVSKPCIKHISQWNVA